MGYIHAQANFHQAFTEVAGGGWRVVTPRQSPEALPRHAEGSRQHLLLVDQLLVRAEVVRVHRALGLAAQGGEVQPL